MRRLFLTTLLVVALCAPAFAGIIEDPGIAAPSTLDLVVTLLAFVL